MLNVYGDYMPNIKELVKDQVSHTQKMKRSPLTHEEIEAYKVAYGDEVANRLFLKQHEIETISDELVLFYLESYIPTAIKEQKLNSHYWYSPEELMEHGLLGLDHLVYILHDRLGIDKEQSTKVAHNFIEKHLS